MEVSHVVRIETANRTTGVMGRSSVGKFSPGQAFTMADVSAPARVARANPVAPVAPLDAILALQGVGDAMAGRKRAVKRGTALLDLLEDVKADLLVGGISAEKLDALVGQLGALRERTEPGLDAVLDDIELRVRVELAKMGRFPPI